MTTIPPSTTTTVPSTITPAITGPGKFKTLKTDLYYDLKLLGLVYIII